MLCMSDMDLLLGLPVAPQGLRFAALEDRFVSARSAASGQGSFAFVSHAQLLHLLELQRKLLLRHC